MNRPIALITGASAGFGEAIARRFAQNNWNLIITARRADRLQALARELESEHDVSVHPLVFDVRNKMQVNQAIASIPSEFQNIQLLVNNAGLASGRDLIQDADVEDWDKMIDTNVKGLLYVTHAVLPMLRKSPGAHIINIGSTAGKETYLGGGVYCASKQAVNALSQAMRIDLLKEGIKVTQICPGAADTEFSLVRFKGDEKKAGEVYKGYTPLYAEDVANVTWFAANQPEHVCLNDIVMTSTAQANSFYTHKSND